MRASEVSRPIYDGAWKLFDQDPTSGRTVWILHEDGGFEAKGKTHFRIDYPVAEVINANREAALDANGKRWGEWARVASIPLNIYHDAGVSEALRQNDRKFLSRWLNDSDNSAWRTREGSV